MNLKPLQLKWDLATGITDNLIPFVSRLHGQRLAIPAQVLNTGQWTTHVVRERSVVAQEGRSHWVRTFLPPCDPTSHPPSARPKTAGTRPIFHWREPRFPVFCSGLGYLPPTRTRPSSPSQEWGEDREGSRAGKRGQQRLWEYSPRSARPLTPPPSLAQAGQRSRGRGIGVRCPSLCQLPSSQWPQGGECDGLPGATETMVDERNEHAKRPTKRESQPSRSHRHRSDRVGACAPAPPAHHGARLARVADVAGRARRTRARGRDLPAARDHRARHRPSSHWPQELNAGCALCVHKGGLLGRCGRQAETWERGMPAFLTVAVPFLPTNSQISGK